MSQSNIPPKALRLSLIAGLFIVSNTVLLGVATTWFPEIIPTIPGAANDTPGLYRLTALGMICGILVLLGAIMLHFNPVNKKVWSSIIIACSIPSVITGGGFIVGFMLGIAGGVSALREPKMPVHAV